MRVESDQPATARLLALGVVLVFGWVSFVTTSPLSGELQSSHLIAGVDPKKKGVRTVIDFRRAKHYGTTKGTV